MRSPSKRLCGISQKAKAEPLCLFKWHRTDKCIFEERLSFVGVVVFVSERMLKCDICDLHDLFSSSPLRSCPDCAPAGMRADRASAKAVGPWGSPGSGTASQSSRASHIARYRRLEPGLSMRTPAAEPRKANRCPVPRPPGLSVGFYSSASSARICRLAICVCSHTGSIYSKRAFSCVQHFPFFLTSSIHRRAKIRLVYSTYAFKRCAKKYLKQSSLLSNSSSSKSC